ncbi:hypothetical protein Sjap_013920 [Stephania japonica]|uniref:Secreted protein n=1 Tax=Stephania japonica TaxID=461633 RepID=A0AAP0IYY5_9MAGN
MEIMKSLLTIAFVVTLVLADHPIQSQGRFHMVDSKTDVYEIDYRGPETHSFVPPPDRSGGGGPWIHHEPVMAQHKLTGTPRRDQTFGDKGKTINGQT